MGCPRRAQKPESWRERNPEIARRLSGDVSRSPTREACSLPPTAPALRLDLELEPEQLEPREPEPGMSPTNGGLRSRVPPMHLNHFLSPACDQLGARLFLLNRTAFESRFVSIFCPRVAVHFDHFSRIVFPSDRGSFRSERLETAHESVRALAAVFFPASLSCLHVAETGGKI